MKVMTEIGIAANILVFLGASDTSYSNAQIAKEVKVMADKCRNALITLREAGIVSFLPEEGNQKRILYTLKKAADEITLNELFDLYEDKLINGVCLFCRMQCRQKENPDYCPFGKKMLELDGDMRRSLARITVQDLINENVSKREAPTESEFGSC